MINRPFALLCLLTFTVITLAKGQLRQGYKALKKLDYETAIKAFEVDVFNKKGDIVVEAEHNLAKIYFTKGYENFSLEQANEYAKRAIDRHDKLEPKEIQKVQKKGMGRLMLVNYKRQIVNMAYDRTKAEDNYKAYQHFLSIFDGPTPIQHDKATQWRNQRGLDEATRLNTWNAYEHLYKKHYESIEKYTPHVDSQLQQWMFESYVNEFGWSAFDRFAHEYPNNVYVTDSAAAANYRPIANSSSIVTFKNFLVGFPKSFFAKLAIDKIMQLTLQKTALENYDYFVRTFPKHPKINVVWKRYYELFLEIQGTDAEKKFRETYPWAPIEKLDSN
jgi:hypothetical protein